MYIIRLRDVSIIGTKLKNTKKEKKNRQDGGWESRKMVVSFFRWFFLFFITILDWNAERGPFLFPVFLFFLFFLLFVAIFMCMADRHLCEVTENHC